MQTIDPLISLQILLDNATWIRDSFFENMNSTHLIMLLNTLAMNEQTLKGVKCTIHPNDLILLNFVNELEQLMAHLKLLLSLALENAITMVPTESSMNHFRPILPASPLVKKPESESDLSDYPELDSEYSDNESNTSSRWTSPPSSPMLNSEIPRWNCEFEKKYPKVVYKCHRYSNYVYDILWKWLHEHMDNPYPSGTEKKELMDATGLSMLQLTNWFSNVRRRNMGHSKERKQRKRRERQKKKQ